MRQVSFNSVLKPQKFLATGTYMNRNSPGFYGCSTIGRFRLRVVIGLCVIKFHTASQVFHMTGSQTVLLLAVSSVKYDVRMIPWES